MTLTTYDDIAEYAAVVLPLLTVDEARHNLAIGVVSNLIRGVIKPTAPPFLGVVAAEGRTGAAIVTPPYGVLLTDLPPGTGRLVAERVHEAGFRPPQVVGPPAAVDEVAQRWCDITRVEVGDVREQGIYALTELTPPAPVEGTARVATPADVDLVVEWLTAFTRELEMPALTTPSAHAARIAAGNVHLWCVGSTPVSTAAISARTPSGARIGPVYTPPEHRRRGYAAAVTAVATSAALRSGAQRCFLYTDLANPTSNAIYRRLGYEWVCESREVTFA